MAVTERTGSQIVELSSDEAMALIAGGGAGRVAVTAAALPAILVVRYAINRGDILFAPASPHPRAALERTVVAFETSGHMRDDSCWSVGVTGIAVPVGDGEPPDVIDLGRWPATEGRLFRLTPAVVAGFRLA